MTPPKGTRKVISLSGLRLYECPNLWIRQETAEVMSLLYMIQESGNLLLDGGWGSQPAWLVEAYQLYRREVLEWQTKKNRDAQEKHGKQQP